jgi:hypothetical protein
MPPAPPPKQGSTRAILGPPPAVTSAAGRPPNFSWAPPLVLVTGTENSPQALPKTKSPVRQAREDSTGRTAKRLAVVIARASP